MTKEYVAYVRISTKHQEGNHSFDSQLKVIEDFMGYAPIEVFKEVASGRNDKRFIVNQALKYCKDNGVMFVSAYLDRFARSVSLLTRVLDDNIEVKFIDYPNADEMVLTIMAAVAKQQAVQTSEKVKAGQAIARLKGKKIGSPENLTLAAREKGRIAREQKSYDGTFAIGQLIIMLRGSKGMNNTEIARWLNRNGQTTVRGFKFRGSEVERIHYKYAVKYKGGFHE